MAIGGYVVTRRLQALSRPAIRHFEDLIEFAKYSWLRDIRS